MKIKFGTDGWRGIIGLDFTVENVIRATKGVIEYLKKTGTQEPSVAIGYDCRFGGEMFAKAVCYTLLKEGIKVYMSGEYCPTPALSYYVRKNKLTLGIMITASHNPYYYNGYKLKSEIGGPLASEKYKEIEKYIPDKLDIQDYSFIFSETMEFPICDINGEYMSYLFKKFNIEEFSSISKKIIYDPMHGAGKKIWKKLFPESSIINSEEDFSFGNKRPEPIQENLEDLINKCSSDDIIFGVATDGDADRIALVIPQYNFIDPHKLFLIFLHYLTTILKKKGKVLMTVSTSMRVAYYCEKMGIPYEIVPVGFKHISYRFDIEDIIMGGEESGGYAFCDHLPERDGIYCALLLMKIYKETNKPLSFFLNSALDICGNFYYVRKDLPANENSKKKVLSFIEGNIDFAPYGKPPKYILKIDGAKYIFEESSLLVRVSGTEPLIRIYSEGKTKEMAEEIITKFVKVALGSSFLSKN